MKSLKMLLSIIVLVGITHAARGGDCTCCPSCGHKVCRVRFEEQTVDKHCYKVECEDICVPQYRLPWQMCCKPKCARVKTVKVLKKHDYECKKCGCVWEVFCVGKARCGAKGCATENGTSPSKEILIPHPKQHNPKSESAPADLPKPDSASWLRFPQLIIPKAGN